MTARTTEPLGVTPAAGGLTAALPRSATVTLTRRDGDRVTVSTWDTCVGVAGFVETLLGEPGQRAEVHRG
ncbi:hypothetical protein Skr01_36580 [Sphaerisporangium krabiense]|uniref:Uncharacterized protein n=1 Tax=Sphaerisporangium krabiense TaxID=763782 RepID=A0A7W8Z421_9ACTN|nr:hypothetical protein [Sphaerisporangium krabiense]MBB5626653.1 hypothetical protein [Sphaerisporangium krabiense]GII63573.1 hypothetical protein Skr01_36580 [Sphaerisporangium krabiense]